MNNYQYQMSISKQNKKRQIAKPCPILYLIFETSTLSKTYFIGDSIVFKVLFEGNILFHYFIIQIIFV
jgi:hypothetical protein